jgi:hypothetical protein
VGDVFKASTASVIASFCNPTNKKPHDYHQQYEAQELKLKNGVIANDNFA